MTSTLDLPMQVPCQRCPGARLHSLARRKASQARRRRAEKSELEEREIRQRLKWHAPKPGVTVETIAKRLYTDALLKKQKADEKRMHAEKQQVRVGRAGSPRHCTHDRLYMMHKARAEALERKRRDVETQEQAYLAHNSVHHGALSRIHGKSPMTTPPTSVPGSPTSARSPISTPSGSPPRTPPPERSRTFPVKQPSRVAALTQAASLLRRRYSGCGHEALSSCAGANATTAPLVELYISKSDLPPESDADVTRMHQEVPVAAAADELKQTQQNASHQAAEMEEESVAAAVERSALEELKQTQRNTCHQAEKEEEHEQKHEEEEESSDEEEEEEEESSDEESEASDEETEEEESEDEMGEIQLVGDASDVVKEGEIKPAVDLPEAPEVASTEAPQEVSEKSKAEDSEEESDMECW